jgi:hypothetical protein
MRIGRLIFIAFLVTVAASLGYWAGYRQGQYHWPSDGSPHARGITLAKVLRQRGITPESIAYLRFIGDESSSTLGRIATNTADVAWIWDRMIQTAEPYVFWESSGSRKIEIYTHLGQQPVATLLVNATDATSIAGDKRSFMCHGLDNLALRLLSGAQTTRTP